MHYFIVDAFTDQAFRGNPAAVVILEKTLTDEQMQNIAAEFNQAETAFLQQKVQDNGRWHLRWFTPNTEVELCGHATLASSHALWRELSLEKNPIVFDTLSGELRASLTNNTITLDFPAKSYQTTNLEQSMLDQLQLTAIAMARGKQELLIEVPSTDMVRNYQPDFSLISQLPYRGLIITAKDGTEFDFVSRFFAPKIGIPEDAVTGAIHCLLTPYWAEKLDKNIFQAQQASARGGVLTLEWQGNRVLLGGKALTTMKGILRC